MKPNYIRKHLNPQQVAKSHAVQKKKTPAGDGKTYLLLTGKQRQTAIVTGPMVGTA